MRVPRRLMNEVMVEKSKDRAFYLQRFVFFLSLVFLGTALAYAAVVWVCSYSGGSVSLFFETPEHDFGEISIGDSPEHQFVFENRGSKPVTIQNILPGCGSCVRVVDYTRSAVSGGDRGYVTLQLLAGLPFGKTSQSAIVTSNDPLAPAMLLILNARITTSSDEM